MFHFVTLTVYVFQSILRYIMHEFIEIGRNSFYPYPMPVWAEKFLVVKNSGIWQPFSFVGHEPLRALYENYEHPHIVVRKAAQLGVSTYSIARAIYAGERYGITTAYYFPTDKDVDDFVDDKFAAILKACPHIANLLKYTDTDNKGLKVFLNFALYFRGVQSKRKVKSITVDFVIKDEVDEANQENLAFADDRMMHSSYKWIVELSQPSVEDFGIDASFKKSDMNYWGVRCKSCRRWEFVDKTFPECLIQTKKTVYIGCSKCGKPLDMSSGQWVPEITQPTERKGYHLSHLIFNILEPSFILNLHTKAISFVEKKNLYISKLGLPYSSKNSKPITLKVLNDAQRDYQPLPSTLSRGDRGGYSYVGMDVGDKCHLVFGHHANGQLRVHWFEELPADEEAKIIRLMKNQNVISGVIDAMPYKTLSKNIARALNGKCYIQYFKGDTLKTGTEGENDKQVLKVTTNRTESLDDTIEMILEGRIVFPSLKMSTGKALDNYNEFRKHLQFLIKDPVERADGTLEYEYKKGVPNHYGMALNSMRIASELASYNVYTGVDPIFL